MEWGRDPYFWPHMKQPRAQREERHDIYLFRGINRQFASAGRRLMFRWTSTSFRTYRRTLFYIATTMSSDYAQTVKSVLLTEHANQHIDLSCIPDTLNRFTELTSLELQWWEGLDTPCFSIHMFMEINLPNLTRLCLDMRRAESAFENMFTAPDWESELLVYGAIPRCFLKLKYLSLKGPLDDDPHRPPGDENDKVMLSIAAMAPNVEDSTLR